MLIEIQIPVAPKGLATSFIETEVPSDYAIALRNRFVNTAGGLEMRQGMRQYGVTVPGGPNLTAIHELVKKDGTTIQFFSGSGSLYRRDSATAYTVVRSGLDTSPLHSVQFDNKLIFENGVDRDFYTEDGVTFTELLAQIQTGTMAAVTGNAFEDTNIKDWAVLGAAANDLVWNVTKGTYGVVTNFVTAQSSAASAAALGRLVHTPMGVSGNGLASGVNNAAGDRYRLIDLVELNVAPTDADPDNVATLVGNTTAAGLNVSGMTNWVGTEIRSNDWIVNTTRQSVVQVSAITSAHITHTTVSGQVTGDSITLHKSAMPISNHMHSHFGHLFHIDSRDRTKIRISARGDPQDMTHGGTLNVGEFKFAGLQPQGDAAKAMTSFQRFFVISGSKYTFLYSGTDPLDQDGFAPIGLFPQGAAAENAVISIGNDAVVITPDGAQSVSLVGDSSTLNRTNISDAIKTTLREELETTPETEIRVIHYPRRSWLLIKIGARLYCFNYSVYVGIGRSLRPEGGSWSIFDGKFSLQNDYRVMQNGDLLCCGRDGKVYIFDDEDYSDDGEAYDTEYESAHLKPQGKTNAIIRTEYVKPIFKTGGDVTYTIEAEGNYDFGGSNDSITVPASAGNAVGNAVVGTAIVGGATLHNQKQPLRIRGETVKIRITTPGGTGPDIIARQSIYYHRHGLG